MKHEIFPQPVHKQPDAPGGSFDTPELRALRAELAERETNEPASTEAALPSSIEGSLMNQAWDEVEAADAESEPLSADYYTPEQAHALIKAIDAIHAENEPLKTQEVQSTPDEVVAEVVEQTTDAAAESYVFSMVDSQPGYTKENPTHVFTHGDREKVHELLRLLKQQSDEQEKAKLFAQLQHFVETGEDMPVASAEQEVAAERESSIDQALVRSSAATARADIEIAFGNDSLDIVMSARSQHERLMELLRNQPEQVDEQVKWEKSVSGVLNVLQNLRDTYVQEVDGTLQKKNAEDPMDAAMPNVFALRPELAEKRRAEIMTFGEVQESVPAAEVLPVAVESAPTEPIASLEDAFSDPSASEWTEDINDDTQIHDTSFARVAEARGAALKKGYKASGVPLGYDPNAPRPTPVQTPPRTGFFKRLFGG